MIPKFDSNHPLSLFDYGVQDIEKLSDKNLFRLADEINKACRFISRNVDLNEFEFKKCQDVRNAIIDKINRVSNGQIIKDDYESINTTCRAIAENRVGDVRELLSFFSKDYIKGYASKLFEYACSRKMIKLLVKNGMSDVSPDTMNKWMNSNLELIDCCIENGVIPKSLMNNLCRRNLIEKDCCPYYLPFLNIVKAMHQYVLTIRDDGLIHRTLNLFAAIDDKEGMELMRDKFSNSSIEFAIRNCNYEMVEMLLGKMDPSTDKHLFSFALNQTGDLDMLQLLEKKGCLGSDQDHLRYASLKEWDKEEKQIPQYDRSLNTQHKKLYGGEGVQEIFHQETKKNITYALFAMREAKQDGKVIESFKPLLICLGNRRRHIALLSRSDAALEFGTPRRLLMRTPLQANYELYKQSSSKSIESTIELNNNEYRLSCIDTKNETQVIYNLYTGFFQENDPVFSHMASLYEKILTTTFENANQLKNEIAAFHWLFANISPFNRGSASIAEVLTDAMWLIHGYMPQLIQQGKSLDLEALTTPDMKLFQNAYPTGSVFVVT